MINDNVLKSWKESIKKDKQKQIIICTDEVLIISNSVLTNDFIILVKYEKPWLITAIEPPKFDYGVVETTNFKLTITSDPGPDFKLCGSSLRDIYIATVVSYIKNDPELKSLAKRYLTMDIYKSVVEALANESFKEEQERKKKQEEYDHCPTCGEMFVTSCRCRRSDRSCKNGHYWHTCVPHQKTVIGQSDHSIDTNACTCLKEEKR